MWTLSRIFLGRLMAWLVDLGNSGAPTPPLQIVYLGLYQAPTGTLTPDSVMSAITEANYTGYAREEVVWYPTYIDTTGPQTLEGASSHFAPTGSAVGNVITGVFLADALTGGNLLMSAVLPVPGVPLNGPSTAMTVDAIFQMAYTANYGTPDVTS